MKKKRFIPFLAALALCAGAVGGCERADEVNKIVDTASVAKPEEEKAETKPHKPWHLADETPIDEQ